MKKAIVGKKIGMTQVFTDDGRLVPVTVVEAGPRHRSGPLRRRPEKGSR